MWQHKASSVISREVALATEALNTDSGLNHRPCHQHVDLVGDLTHTVTIISHDMTAKSWHVASLIYRMEPETTTTTHLTAVYPAQPGWTNTRKKTLRIWTPPRLQLFAVRRETTGENNEN